MPSTGLSHLLLGTWLSHLFLEWGNQGLKDANLLNGSLRGRKGAKVWDRWTVT